MVFITHIVFGTEFFVYFFCQTVEVECCEFMELLALLLFLGRTLFVFFGHYITALLSQQHVKSTHTHKHFEIHPHTQSSGAVCLSPMDCIDCSNYF